MSSCTIDTGFMRQAIALAAEAKEKDEVPVGAVLVQNGAIIGSAGNAPIANSDATAHAEILAIRQACATVQNYRLPNATLYLTLEPCAMCAGAIVHARIKRVLIATKEPRAGAAGSCMNILQHEDLNHRCIVEFGLFQQESAKLLTDFFQYKRSKR